MMIHFYEHVTSGTIDATFSSQVRILLAIIVKRILELKAQMIDFYCYISLPYD